MSLIKLISATAVTALLCSSSASDRQELKTRIEVIEDIINVKPDSALMLIRNIRAEDVTSNAWRAKLSLLHSISLDKNHIDLTNDSILQPAIKYYERKGAAEDQIRTLYYTARIHENSKDYENAIRCLVKAENISRKGCHPEILSLVHSAKGRIYQNILDYDKAAESYNSAAIYSQEDGDKERFVSNILREAHCRIMCDETDKANDIIKKIEGHIGDLSVRSLNRYYQLLISIHEKQNPEMTYSITEDYLTAIQDERIIDWLLAARIYLKSGETEKAFQCLNRYDKEKTGTYHYLLAQAHEFDQEYECAMNEYKNFIRSYGIIGDRIISQDTKFIEEREMHHEMHEKEKNRRSVLSLGILTILLGLSLACACIANIRKQLKIENLRKEKLQRQLDELLMEREELALLEYRNREGRKIISERLRIIDQFVMSDAFNDSIFEAKASETLKTIIGDRAEFVRQNRLIFNQSAPRFISHLIENGLTDIEIDHCCLYAIGMNGKMVTTFTNAKRHYHIGSDVRKKLGLNPHDTNISIYIRNLYHQMQG